ncbi:GntR family transcriptional regulator [Curtobacterium sp. ISL-83]|uniref:GntR family transcriptional regulator n=1 Tax=Curtobacterium sp. ISL-83 TaxID=2819145 RepID=UPI001BE63958|nr:GntR family transcriptional regulator [Curtobacterium sp. ISL-83]MBT2502642.1 GntR family transcriptional regulator [Curtobacterium sp. ISL-83]
MFLPTDGPDRPRLRDQARDRLRTEILDGSIPPGTRLDDEVLAARLRCSRTPVREALSDLAHLGLVELRANRYTRVTLPRSDELIPTMQALGLLFAGVIRTTVPVLSDEGRVRLFHELGKVLETPAAASARVWPTVASVLYGALVAECRNPLLTTALRGAVDGLTFRLRHDDLETVLPWGLIRAGLVELRIAVDGRDGPRAERASRVIHLLPGRDGSGP